MTEELDPLVDSADLQAMLAALVRGDLSQFESTLFMHGEPTNVPGTKATFRCHFIRGDGNGKPRVKAFARLLAAEVMFHCIPRSDLDAMNKIKDANDRTREMVRLHSRALDLFTKNQPKSGEGGELLLYALLEQGLGAPQILSKMSLKTNTNVQVHGTDGVHAKVLDNGTLALYWGESKIYGDLSSALSDCFDSIAPYLTGEATDQDVWLIRHYADLGNPELASRVFEFFDDASPKSASVEVKGACLIGFSHDDYPNLPAELETLQQKLDKAVETWKASIASRLVKRKIQTFDIEVFFLPVPSADELRKAILGEIR